MEDAVSERAASLAERLDALETPPSARSLREARALLTHQPALAQQAQGECVDRDNATKIL